MGEKTAIRWTDSSWNPVTGCSHVSPGCENCYAETLSLRRGWSLKPWTAQNATENVILHPDRLGQPTKWKQPQMVFVNSMSDVFHAEISDSYIDRIFAAMLATPRHTYQVLTKRPDRMAAYIAGWLPRVQLTEVPDFIWLGTSIESDRFTGRAEIVRSIPAAVRFLSCEPLLGPLPSLSLTGIHWCIVGGESGPGFRPMEMAWARQIRDKAEAAGTAYYFKQDAAFRTETRMYLLEEDGSHTVYEQYPVRGEEQQLAFA